MKIITMKMMNTTATRPNFNIKDDFDVDKTKLDDDDDENDQHHGHHAQL